MAEKLIKSTKRIAEAIGVSDSRVRQLRQKTTLALCQRSDGLWNLEKVLQWDALRKDLGRPPSPEEMTAGGMDARELQVSNDRAVLDKYRRTRLDVMDKAQVVSAEAYLAAAEELKVKVPDMKAHELINFMGRAAVGYGVFYDKSRLERGESTENVSVMVSMIKEMRKEMRDGGV